MTKLIALHLPQFHPIPENDEWWGKGFTEWTNVTRARPRFRGHSQPHLPADLGFYDLRLPEARAAQADLASRYGIGGFCYYHYWFNGRRLLERPVNEILASGEPRFPFCLCWANENWTRRWDGLNEEVLIGQNYNHDDDRAHIRWLATVFRDRRYIRVDGKPLFLVYRVSALQDAAATVRIWREEARRLGIGELFLVNFESWAEEVGATERHGFDAGLEFAPDFSVVGPTKRLPLHLRAARRLGLIPKTSGTDRIVDYGELMRRSLAKPTPPYRRFNMVTPMWDNSSRRKTSATIVVNGSAELYRDWLAEAIRRTRPMVDGTRLVFVNAWNEWAEGNHLEPCQRYGHAYLEATKSALEATDESNP